MAYTVLLSESAKAELAVIKHSGYKATIKKIANMLVKLQEHPRTGTGKPKQLSGDRVGQWRRKISDKHRLIYEIHDQVVEVLVLSAWGHYDDK